MLRSRIIVDAMWDDEAHVFVATSADVPGLVTEAPTWEELRTKLNMMIPELLQLNCEGQEQMPNADAELVMMGEHRSRVRLRA